MSIKDKTALKTENDTLYDDAIGLTQEVTATNQKSVTSDQVDSFVGLKDRIVSVDVSVGPLVIVLDFTSVEQYILDLTAEPATKIFNISSILGVESGQNSRIQVIKNTDQSITIAVAEGPAITKADNPLQLTGVGAPTAFFYSYLDDALADSNSDVVLDIFVDDTAGSDANDGLTEAAAFKTEDKAYELAVTAVTSNIVINRNQGDTFLLTTAVTLVNKNLTFKAFGAGADPIVKSSGAFGQLSLSGSLRVFNTKLDSAGAALPYFLVTSLDTFLETGTIDVNTILMFGDAGGSAPSRLTFTLSSSFVIDGSVGLTSITSVAVRASDVVGTATIVDFTENIASSVFNIVDGLTPVIDITFQGDDTLDFGAIVKIDEHGPDVGKWTVSNDDFEVGGIDSGHLINDVAAGSGTGLRDSQLSEDGLEMFILDVTAGTPRLSKHVLTTAFEIGTMGGISQSFDLSTEYSSVESFHLLSDGSEFYVVGTTIAVPTSPPTLPPGSKPVILHYDMGTNFDLTTVSIKDEFTNVEGEDTTPKGLHLSDDQENMYMIGKQNSDVTNYQFGTTGDLDTSIVLSTIAILDDGPQSFWDPRAIHLSLDGLKMFIMGANTFKIFEYDLGTPHITSTLSGSIANLSIRDDDASPTGVHLTDTLDRVYIIGTSGDRIYQYSLNGPRTYNLLRIGSGEGTENYVYSIRGQVEDENVINEVSGVSIERQPTGAIIAVENGASRQKDFSIQVFKNS